MARETQILPTLEAAHFAHTSLNKKKNHQNLFVIISENVNEGAFMIISENERVFRFVIGEMSMKI